MISINSIESFSTVDGPGIRTTIFVQGCPLRCKFCHNPETWVVGEKNYKIEDLVEMVIRNKPYYKNGGGVTISGGEPLFNQSVLLKLVKRLKEEGIHVAIDTSGYSSDIDNELLSLIDLFILDVKDTNQDRFKELTGGNFDNYMSFIKILKEHDSKILLRQVIVPNWNDSFEYMNFLADFIKRNFKQENITKIEFLPFHQMADEKYKKLNIEYPFKDKDEANVARVKELYDYLMSKLENQ